MVGLSVVLSTAAGYEAANGYAIPVDSTFRRATETLMQGREVEYGFLGIQPVNLRPQEVQAGLTGTRVGQVAPGTPAARYGLKVGDIVTAVDNTPLYDADGLVLNVGRLPAEAVTQLSVLRGGSRRIVPVTLTKYAVHGKKIVTVAEPPWRGLRVDYPTAVVDEEGPGRGGRAFVDDAVAVADVAEGSPAWQAGLRRGTLISHVGATAVHSPREFAAAVASFHGTVQGTVQLRVAGEEKGALRTVPPGP
jgi:serine protease Do